MAALAESPQLGCLAAAMERNATQHCGLGGRLGHGNGGTNKILICAADFTVLSLLLLLVLRLDILDSTQIDSGATKAASSLASGKAEEEGASPVSVDGAGSLESEVTFTILSLLLLLVLSLW